MSEKNIISPNSPPQEISQFLQTGLYSGPIPPPYILAGFKELMPDVPERLVKIAEDVLLKHEDAILKRNQAMSLGRGQWLSFILGIAGFGLAAVFAFNGMEAGAIAAAIGGVTPHHRCRSRQFTEIEPRFPLNGSSKNRIVHIPTPAWHFSGGPAGTVP